MLVLPCQLSFSLLTSITLSDTLFDMKYKISKERKSATFTCTQKERKILREMGQEVCQDQAMYNFFEGLISNSELEWIQPYETGDLTSAPIIGIYSENGKVKERWAFMDYQLRSVLEDLRDFGKVIFIS